MKDLSLHIMDILRNSIRAEAKRIILDLELKGDKLIVEFIDNGKGMDEETLAKVEDPFFTSRTTRKVGLGISLLKQNCEKTGGNFSITSKIGEGTSLQAVFNYKNLDMLPIGDINGVLMLCVSSNQNIQFILKARTKESEFVFDTEEIKRELEIENFNSPELNAHIRDYIGENIRDFLDLI